MQLSRDSKHKQEGQSRVGVSERGRIDNEGSGLLSSRASPDSRGKVECEVMSDDEGQRERRFGRVIGEDRLIVAWRKHGTRK